MSAVESPRAQIERLASFILAELHGEPSADEGAVDCAIRLLRVLASTSQHSERTARVVGLWSEANRGWSYAIADVPEPVLRRYAVSVHGPEILPIVLAQCEEALERHAARGVIR